MAEHRGLATRRQFASTSETEWENAEPDVTRFRHRAQCQYAHQPEDCAADSAYKDKGEEKDTMSTHPDVTISSWTPAGTSIPPHHLRTQSTLPIVDPDTFPYPDPLQPGSDPPSRFLDRLLVLARLEADTKRQEERRSASTVPGRRSVVYKRRPGERLVSAGPRRIPQESRQRPRTAVATTSTQQSQLPQQHRPRVVPPSTSTSASTNPPRPRTCPPEASRGAGAQLPRGTGRPLPNTAATGRTFFRRASPSLACSALLRLDFSDQATVSSTNSTGSLRKSDDVRRRQESQTVISLQYIGGGRTVPHPHMIAAMRPGMLGPAPRGNVEFLPIRQRLLLKSPATCGSGSWSVQLRQK